MKNKLLLTTAIAGSLLASGVAMAETKITGSMDISYSGRSADASAGAASTDGFGSETQLNISNSGDLNNGMSYKAGFSMESDTSTDAFENAYIDINLASGTTLSFGSDHFPPLDGTITPLVSVAIDTVAGGGTGAGSETITDLAYFNILVSKTPPGGKALVKIYPKGLQKSISLIFLTASLTLFKISNIFSTASFIRFGAILVRVSDNPCGIAIIKYNFVQMLYLLIES